MISSVLIERFEAKFTPEPTSGCWLWMAAQDTRGYGVFDVGFTRRATHFALRAYRGIGVPRGMDAMHSCDNTSCVNPWHLAPGTRRQNMRDCVRRGRHSNGPSELRRGTCNGRSKLTVEQVLEIRARRGVETQAHLATRFGVAESLISIIQTGKIWTHIGTS